MNRSTHIRRGMTLIEIMIAILILSVGLLGVLAAVPFGAMQMGKMVEKDFVTTTATNAHNIIAVNGWHQPTYWCNTKTENSMGSHYANKNFTFPVLLDPIGFADFPFDYTDTVVSEKSMNLDLNPSGAINFIFPEKDVYILDRLFRCVDDIVYERDDNSSNRPQMLLDTENPNQAAFTGEYSWMAMMSPSAVGSGNDYTDFQFPTEDPDVTIDVKTDVVVFRGRVPGDATDYIVSQATVQGSGYAGGKVLLEKTSDISSADGPAYAASLAENLKSSTHLLLIGPSDLGGQYTTHWYKIANYSESDLSNGIPVTLIGESCPNCWTSTASGQVRAVVFKNVRGILTKTMRLSAD